MEPTYSHSEVRTMFYEWFQSAFPEKFPHLTVQEGEALCEYNFKNMIATKDTSIKEKRD